MSSIKEFEPKSYRLNAVGHPPGCICEQCFYLIERALRQYLPGFLPDEPDDPRIAHLDVIIRGQREEIYRLRAELARLGPLTAHGLTEKRGLDVER